MAGFVDALERAVLDHVLNDGAYTPPANWFVGLSTTTPLDDGTGFTEPVGNAYARLITAAADWAAATGTAPAIKSNGTLLTMATPTGAWGTVSHFGLFTALSGGTPQIWGVLGTPQPIVSGNGVTWAIGALKIELGDTADTF